MKFGIVDPRTARAEIIEAPDWQTAGKEIGLESGRTDSGMIVRDATGGLAYFCYEFGLFVPTDQQSYFSILGLDRKPLIAGAAVFYAFDAAGETVDLEELPPLLFYRDAHEVEKAIRAGDVDRPQIAINNQVIWRWPERTTDESIISRMREHGVL